MSDENQFLRYVVPGVAAGLILLAALFVALPDEALHHLASENAPIGMSFLLNVVGLVLTGLVTAGGLGFVLAQVYFALPSQFNTADHRSAMQIQRPSNPWSHPYEGNRSRLEAHRKARLIWATHVAEQQGQLEAMTDLCARRMAAVGATLVGNALAGVIWLAILMTGAVGRPTAFGWLIGGLVILIPGLLLWRTWHKIRKDLEGIVQAGLAHIRASRKGGS